MEAVPNFANVREIEINIGSGALRGVILLQTVRQLLEGIERVVLVFLVGLTGDMSDPWDILAREYVRGYSQILELPEGKESQFRASYPISSKVLDSSDGNALRAAAAKFHGKERKYYAETPYLKDRRMVLDYQPGSSAKPGTLGTLRLTLQRVPLRAKDEKVEAQQGLQRNLQPKT